jgi:hypothetical protein
MTHQKWILICLQGQPAAPVTTIFNSHSLTVLELLASQEGITCATRNSQVTKCQSYAMLLLFLRGEVFRS